MVAPTLAEPSTNTAEIIDVGQITVPTDSIKGRRELHYRYGIGNL